MWNWTTAPFAKNKNDLFRKDPLSFLVPNGEFLWERNDYDKSCFLNETLHIPPACVSSYIVNKLEKVVGRRPDVLCLV